MTSFLTWSDEGQGDEKGKGAATTVIHDVVIRDGLIVDGNGGRPYVGQVGISGRRISYVGSQKVEGDRYLDARGLMISPGFIDLHTHSDFTLLLDGRAASKIMQGVTTEIIGNCGVSVAPLRGAGREVAAEEAMIHGAEELMDWETLDQYFERLEEARPALNVGALMGHGVLRAAVVGLESRPASSDELELMGELLQEGLNQGAWGLSAGLFYAPGSFASGEEMTALCTQLARSGALYTCHIRDESNQVQQALQDFLDLTLRTGVRSQLSHIKAETRMAWGWARRMIEQVEDAHQQGAQVAADLYPYRASATSLSGNLLSLSRWAEEGGRSGLLERLTQPPLRQQIELEIATCIERRGGPHRILISRYPPNSNWVGRTLGDLCRQEKKEAHQVVAAMLEESDGACICFDMIEEDIQEFLLQPWVAVASDGRAVSTNNALRWGSPHPRSFGAFPRVLSEYVRHLQLLDWGDAIRKMTSLPAERLGLADRGRLEAGLYADLVLFDPQRIADKSTYSNPYAYPEGISEVMVNGVLVVEEGRLTGARPGQILRRIR